MALSVDEFWEALDILDELHASGEIDEATYRARRRDLESGLNTAARSPRERWRSAGWFAAGLAVGVLSTVLVTLFGGALLP